MKKFLLLFILISLPAFGSDLVDKRKENYQANKDHMRFNYNAIKSGDLAQVIKSSVIIENFAAEMTSYFPEGSESRGANDNIWIDFKGFEKSARAKLTAVSTISASNRSSQSKFPSIAVPPSNSHFLSSAAIYLAIVEWFVFDADIFALAV